MELLFWRIDNGSWIDLTRSSSGVDESSSIVDEFRFSLRILSPNLSWFEMDDEGCCLSCAMSGDRGADKVPPSTFCFLFESEVCGNRDDDNDDDDVEAYMSTCSMPGATVGVKGI